MPEQPPEIVISNTSPLFYLHRAGYLDLLRQLYGRIHVTPHIITEMKAGSPDDADVPSLTDIPWITERTIAIPPSFCLIPDLGEGEASVIALAMDAGTRALLILDDRLARRIAASHRLRVTGTAGVLLRAKQASLIGNVRRILAQLRNKGFYLKPEHFERVCRMAGE